MAVNYEKDGKIAIITINRPEAMNSLNVDVRKEMQEALEDFRDNPDLWVAIITGAGDRAFSAGADIKDFRPAAAEDAEKTTAGPQVRADTIWKPFIAAIHGYCLGGGLELAMTCDIRIAADNAKLGQPEVNIGFMPGAGATQRLPRFIPRAVAAEILLTGNRIDAQEALRIGLVSRVVPRDQLMPTAMEIANTICERGPLGVRATKEAMVRGYDMALEDGLVLERKLVAHIRTTDDFMEGARAFAQKRPPEYKAK
ncbi:MAG: enoyl-CoA hydratase/isomerase family protein [Deltaproteobacteria bacterium]|nr:enoyl-CoA hydratase/isomerase family protein [Deltaproteobacteria bacterium]MBW2050914.1 enoyl-CoA hydratase/isomerase family protein [Deltaproteobacteria bacterium]MBW2139573.1 enoyl-CoA hydratase/isomerase family protein [Deltaproteobacteria bacterium]